MRRFASIRSLSLVVVCFLFLPSSMLLPVHLATDLLPARYFVERVKGKKKVLEVC